MSYNLCFLVVLGDVSVVMETKHLRGGVEGQGANIVDVALVVGVWGSIVDATLGKPADNGVDVRIL